METKDMGLQKTSLSCGVIQARDQCYFQYFAINNRNVLSSIMHHCNMQMSWLHLRRVRNEFSKKSLFWIGPGAIWNGMEIVPKQAQHWRCPLKESSSWSVTGIDSTFLSLKSLWLNISEKTIVKSSDSSEDLN